MDYKFIKITEFEQRDAIKNLLGIPNDAKTCGPFGILNIDELTIYILNAGAPHFPVYLLVDYNEHRYGLLGSSKKQPGNQFWEIQLIDTAIDDNDEIKKMLQLVCDNAHYIDLFNNFTITIVVKEYEKLIIQNIKENAYGIKLY